MGWLNMRYSTDARMLPVSPPTPTPAFCAAGCGSLFCISTIALQIFMYVFTCARPVRGWREARDEHTYEGLHVYLVPLSCNIIPWKCALHQPILAPSWLTALFSSAILLVDAALLFAFAVDPQRRCERELRHQSPFKARRTPKSNLHVTPIQHHVLNRMQDSSGHACGHTFDERRARAGGSTA